MDEHRDGASIGSSAAARRPGRAHAPVRALGAAPRPPAVAGRARARGAVDGRAGAPLHATSPARSRSCCRATRPASRAVDELRQRLPGLSTLGVVVATSSTVRAARGRAPDRRPRGARARATRPSWCARSRPATEAAAERRFLAAHLPLFVDLDDLVEVRARVEARRSWDTRNRLGIAFDEENAPPPLDFSDIEAKYQARYPGVRLPTKAAPRGDARAEPLHGRAVGHDAASDRRDASRRWARTRAASCWRACSTTSQALGGPTHYAPGLRVGFAGNIAISVEELSALSADLGKSSVLVVRRGAAGDPAVLPLVGGAAAAVHAARGRDRDLVRAGDAAAVPRRSAQLEHRLPRFDRRRQRHQLRRHLAGALRGGAAPRGAAGGGAGRGDVGRAARHAGRRRRRRDRVRVADDHGVPRLPPVRNDRRGRHAGLLGRDLPARAVAVRGDRAARRARPAAAAARRTRAGAPEPGAAAALRCSSARAPSSAWRASSRWSPSRRSSR